MFVPKRKNIKIDDTQVTVEYNTSSLDGRVFESHGFVSCWVIEDGLRTAQHRIPKQVVVGKANCYTGGHWYKQIERQ